MASHKKISRKDILALLRKTTGDRKYPMTAINEMMAELVIRTSKYNKRCKVERLSQILDMLYGKSFGDNPSQDDEDAMQVLALMNVGVTAKSQRTEHAVICEVVARHYDEDLADLKNRREQDPHFLSHVRRIKRKIKINRGWYRLAGVLVYENADKPL